MFLAKIEIKAKKKSKKFIGEFLRLFVLKAGDKLKNKGPYQKPDELLLQVRQ